MDILRILDDLHDLAVERPKTVFGPLTWGLDKDEISMQISKVRASLPTELKQAVQTMRESDRIVESARVDAVQTLESAKREAERVIAEARIEAERMIEQARLQQEKMVNESEILKLSKAQSEEIRNAAERDAVQTRRGAEQYAIDVLSQLEGVVGKVMTTLDRGKQEMVRAVDPPMPLPRERLRTGG
jgi:hypothetical protein